jgi:hypothetical protein
MLNQKSPACAGLEFFSDLSIAAVSIRDASALLDLREQLTIAIDNSN